MVEIVDYWADVYPEDWQPDIDVGGGDILVEVSGYVPKQVQLARLMQSGKALDDYLKRVYPNYELQPTEVFYDPTIAVALFARA